MPVTVAQPSAQTEEASERFGPWNPGISSQLTPELWRLCTIFRPENAFAAFDQVVEYGDLTGLPFPNLVVFRPERLVLHEVLVRVSADYEVPDPEGADVRSLGMLVANTIRSLGKT